MKLNYGIQYCPSAHVRDSQGLTFSPSRVELSDGDFLEEDALEDEKVRSADDSVLELLVLVLLSCDDGGVSFDY
jgi:hypothetical protein